MSSDPRIRQVSRRSLTRERLVYPPTVVPKSVDGARDGECASARPEGLESASRKPSVLKEYMKVGGLGITFHFVCMRLLNVFATQQKINNYVHKKIRRPTLVNRLSLCVEQHCEHSFPLPLVVHVVSHSS